MTKSIGRDRRTREKFQIVGVNKEKGIILIRNLRNGWLDNQQEPATIEWALLVQDIADGFIEFTHIKDESIL